MTYASLGELIRKASEQKSKISRIVLADQSAQMEISEKVLYEKMSARLDVMRESDSRGRRNRKLSLSGLSGQAAGCLERYGKSHRSLLGKPAVEAMVTALAVTEQNAAMGRICAAPTAGSCGILPAVLLTAMDEWKLEKKDVVMSLFTAAGVGMVLSNRASLAGASGGCQAECGSASAMAAAALTELEGGTPEMAGHACALAIEGLLGLVCDPVAGLVEIPCVKRNAFAAVHAIAAAEMALAGIPSRIPVDEVIDAMKQVGELMPASLKETSKAGLAATDTAKRFEKKWKESMAGVPQSEVK